MGDGKDDGKDDSNYDYNDYVFDDEKGLPICAYVSCMEGVKPYVMSLII